MFAKNDHFHQAEGMYSKQIAEVSHPLFRTISLSIASTKSSRSSVPSIRDRTSEESIPRRNLSTS